MSEAQSLVPKEKSVRQRVHEAQKKNQEKVLLRKPKKLPEWKVRKGVSKKLKDVTNEHRTGEAETGARKTGGFRSQLDRIQEKVKRNEEIEEVKKGVRKQMTMKNKLSKNIAKVLKLANKRL